MRNAICLLLAVSALFLSGCAIGPLVSHETARTVGNSNHELIGGYGVAGYAIKWNYGLTENLDIGLHLESLSIGVRSKYAFLNNKSGWSIATALGLGSSIGGRHYYGDLMASYMASRWEPYSTLRFVHVKNDPIEFRDENTGKVDFTINNVEYDYGQVILGTRYWFTEKWLLSLEASSLFTYSSGVSIGSNLLLAAAFGVRF